jgi:adenylate cyclase
VGRSFRSRFDRSICPSGRHHEWNRRSVASATHFGRSAVLSTPAAEQPGCLGPCGAQYDLDTAVDLATQAVEIAPDYGLAYGIKAFAQGFQSYTQWGQDWYEDAKQASNNIKRALALQGDDPTTLFLVGGASHFMARHRTGVALLERAVQLNPNLAMAHGLLGLSYASIDRPAEGLSHVETALRLSPRDPMTYSFFLSQAPCKFVSGDYSGALSSAERSASIHPGSDCHLYMAAALAELGELDKAREQIKRALAFSPKMNLVVIGRGVQGNPGWEKYHAALRKAGLPE